MRRFSMPCHTRFHMRKKSRVIIYSIISVLCFSMTGCGTVSTSEEQATALEEPIVTEDMNEEDFIVESEQEPVLGPFPLSVDTEKFLFGKWKVKKLLGFCNSWNDASEYPNGQDIIGDEIIIQANVFSSLGFKKYKVYQYKYSNPYYYINRIFYDTLSLYRAWKLQIPGLKDNDKIQDILVSSNPQECSAPMSFICINNERLILSLEATIFELEKIKE